MKGWQRRVMQKPFLRVPPCTVHPRRRHPPPLPLRPWYFLQTTVLSTLKQSQTQCMAPNSTTVSKFTVSWLLHMQSSAFPLLCLLKVRGIHEAILVARNLNTISKRRETLNLRIEAWNQMTSVPIVSSGMRMCLASTEPLPFKDCQHME